MNRASLTLRETIEVAADQPFGSDRHEPTDHERAVLQWPEDTRPHVRVHAIGQLVDKVLRDERVAVAALHFEYALHHVAPPQQQLTIVLAQVRPIRHEPLHHGLSAAKLVL